MSSYRELRIIKRNVIMPNAVMLSVAAPHRATKFWPNVLQEDHFIYTFAYNLL